MTKHKLKPIRCANKDCNREIKHSETYIVIILHSNKKGHSKKSYLCKQCMILKQTLLIQLFNRMLFGNLLDVTKR